MGKEYKMESIIGHKITGDDVEYLIKWVGYKSPTYEPEKNIVDKKFLQNQHSLSSNKKITNNKTIAKRAPVKTAVRSAVKTAVRTEVKTAIRTERVRPGVRTGVKAGVRTGNRTGVKTGIKKAVRQGKQQVINRRTPIVTQKKDLKTKVPKQKVEKPEVIVVEEKSVTSIKNVFRDEGKTLYTVNCSTGQQTLNSDQLAKNTKPEMIVKFFEDLIE